MALFKPSFMMERRMLLPSSFTSFTFTPGWSNKNLAMPV
jgi:hypothetical protein